MVNENIFIYFIRDVVFFGIIVCFYIMCYIFYINVLGFTGVLLFIVVCSRRENSKLVYLVGGIKI